MRRLAVVLASTLTACFCAGASTIAAHATSTSQYTLTDLQQFGVSSAGWAINDAAQVTGSIEPDTSNSHVFRYSGGVVSDLGTLGGPSGIGISINTNGEVVGWSLIDPSSFTTHAFYTSGDTLIDLKTLAEGTPVGPYVNSQAFGVNDGGLVVGESQIDGPGTRAFLYNGLLRQLPLPGAYAYSGGMAINNQGQILFKTQQPGFNAFIYSGYAGDGGGGSFVQIPALVAGGLVIGADINNGGVVVGQATPVNDPLGFHAFRYSGGVSQDLGLLPGFPSTGALSINDSGLIVGCAFNDTDEHGFIYDGALHDLNDLVAPGSGMVLGCAGGINNAGQITGEGLVNGVFHAYLLTPSTATPLGTNVAVSPTDPNTGSSPVTLNFSDVTGAGTTTLDITSTGPSLPSGYSLGNGVYYEVATTATYSGSITVCIVHTGLLAPSLWHYANGTWTQVTPVTDDGTTICGSVTSLSPFALLLRTGGRPPTVDPGGPYAVDEGGSVVVTATGSDPGGETLTFVWDLDGNGTFETPGRSVSFSAAGLDGPTTQTVNVQATNTDGLSATAATSISVANVAPTVGGIELPAGPVLLGATVSTSASFIDPAPGDTHAAQWDWGDGSTSPGAIVEAVGAGTATGSHAYLAPGSYTITVYVTDDDGGTSAAQATLVAIYNICLLYDPNKPLKGGVAPIKLALCDAHGTDLSAPSVVVTAVSTTSPRGLVGVGNTNRGNLFRYDATLGTSGGYIFNLDTTGDPPGAYVLRFTVGQEPYVYSVGFTVG